MAVPKLRFKEFDGDWNKQRLDSFLERVSNPVNVVVDQKYTQIGIRSHGKGIFHKDSIDGKGLGNKRVFWVEPNAFVVNIVFAWERAIAVTSEAEKGMIASHRFPMYLPKNNLSNVNFLRYMFVTNKGQSYLELASPGGAGRNKTLGQSNFAELKIDLPHQKEQTKIVSFLSSVDEKISQLTQKRELLSQYKQGMMQKLFSQQLRFKADDGGEFGEWEEKIIKDIADVKGGKRIPKGYSLVNENTGHPYITVSDMNRSYSIDGMNIRYVPLEVVDIIKRYTITDKDIFISVAGTLGIIGKIPVKFNGANLTENADKLTNLRCHQDFLIYLLDSGYLSELIESTATTSAQPKLALYAIEQLEIKIPCLEEQTKIANFLSTIDQKIDVVAQQIEHAKTWKKGLLQQMFV